MAKVAKDSMKVKTGLKTYECNWSFKTPVNEWSKETLLANIRAGIRYAIARHITLSVQSDEQNTTRNNAMVNFMMTQLNVDAEKLSQMNEFCTQQEIKTSVQTEFVFVENDFSVEPVDSDDEVEVREAGK